MVLDPFAGTGKIHELKNCITFGVELEPEWALMHPRTYVGDATKLPDHFNDAFHMVITSPCYANRMADHHTPSPSDTSKRFTYTHMLGRKLSAGSTANMQWGEEYRFIHTQAWIAVRRVLCPGGWFVLNVRDHIRKKMLVPVSAWHLETVLRLGFEQLDSWYIETPGMRFGANSDKRVDGEHVFLFRNPISPQQEQP
jgi:hypothetical protein